MAKQNAPFHSRIISEDALLALRDRVGGPKTISLYAGQRYNIALIMRTLRKPFVNAARSVGVLFQKTNDSSERVRTSGELLRFASRALLFAGIFVFAIAASLTMMRRSPITSRSGQIAGASTVEPRRVTAFEQWMQDNAGFVGTKEADEDGDGLTNYEEFLVGSKPTFFSSCNQEGIGDAEAILNLLHPGTCQTINLENEREEELFSQLVNLESVRVLNYETLPQEAEVVEDSEVTIQEVFQAGTLDELNEVATPEFDIQSEAERIEQERLRAAQKEEYLTKVSRIDEYMRLNRSFEPYDRNYPIPVGGAVYLQVSEQYNVPLKYVLAIAQRESRFGTDRYSHKGYLTRPGQYENIVSMGLDDEGNNLSFGGWAASVESFGQWYRRFDDAGVSDCAKWRIYNPNGDYCKHVEETAAGIEAFLGF